LSLEREIGAAALLPIGARNRPDAVRNWEGGGAPRIEPRAVQGETRRARILGRVVLKGAGLVFQREQVRDFLVWRHEQVLEILATHGAAGDRAERDDAWPRARSASVSLVTARERLAKRPS
jgi:hypothetical protein